MAQRAALSSRAVNRAFRSHSAAARLAEAERLFRDARELSPYKFRPFVKHFNSFAEYDAASPRKLVRRVDDVTFFRFFQSIPKSLGEIGGGGRGHAASL